MKGFKKIILLCVVFAMVMSTIASAAVNFTDLPDNWAKEYIVKAAELGLIKGYEDGSFRPTNNVTRMETMLMLSRLYKVDEDIKKQIEEKYVPFIKETTGGKDEWAYNELAMALELKLLSNNRFSVLYENSAIKSKAPREDVAVFVIKALCLQEEVDNLNKSTYTVVFKDAEKISNEYRAYVHLAYEKGIVLGDENNNFNPDKFITREQFAAILSRAYDYAVKNNTMPSFDSYATYENVSGKIGKITLNTLESYIEIIQEETEEKRIVTLNEKTVVNIDKKASSISNLAVDMVVSCVVNAKTNVATAVIGDTSVKTVEGIIKNVYSGNVSQLVIVDNNKKEQVINVPESAAVKYEGRYIAFKELKSSNPVVITYKDNVVTEIASFNRTKIYSGTILSIEYGFPIKLNVKTTNGEKLEFVYDSEPNVIRNNVYTTFDQLRIGDSVDVSTNNGVLYEVIATSYTASTDTTGTIKEIKIGSSNTISVQNEDGVTTEYTVSNSAAITVMDRISTIYDLRVGYKAKLIINDSEVISIEVNDVENSQELTGKVVYVNHEKKMIMLQTENVNGQKELVYLNVATDTVIMTVKGQSRSLDSIALGDSIISVGSYTGGMFDAISVIIK